MFCFKCGNYQPDNVNFCAFCGASLKNGFHEKNIQNNVNILQKPIIEENKSFFKSNKNFSLLGGFSFILAIISVFNILLLISINSSYIFYNSIVIIFPIIVIISLILNIVSIYKVRNFNLIIIAFYLNFIAFIFMLMYFAYTFLIKFLF